MSLMSFLIPKVSASLLFFHTMGLLEGKDHFYLKMSLIVDLAELLMCSSIFVFPANGIIIGRFWFNHFFFLGEDPS